MSPGCAGLAPCRCAPRLCACTSQPLAPGGDTGEEGAATGVQPLPKLPLKLLPFPSLSAALKWLQVPQRAGLRKEGRTRPDRAHGQGNPATGHLHPSARREGLSWPSPGHCCPSACHRCHLLSRPEWPPGERLSSEKAGGILQTPTGGRKGGKKTCHAKHPDSAAWLSSASSSGKRCPAVLSAVHRGKLEAGVAVSAGQRMRAEGPQGEGGRLGSWVPYVGSTERTRARWWPGGLELLLGHWSATLGILPAQGQQEASHQGQ